VNERQHLDAGVACNLGGAPGRRVLRLMRSFGFPIGKARLVDEKLSFVGRD